MSCNLNHYTNLLFYGLCGSCGKTWGLSSPKNPKITGIHKKVLSEAFAKNPSEALQTSIEDATGFVGDHLDSDWGNGPNEWDRGRDRNEVQDQSVEAEIESELIK